MQVATTLYPDAANTWDSLGELYVMQGDTAQARIAYRKALALQPGMGSAEAALKKLGE